MATVHTPPIDQYEESQDDRQQRWSNPTPDDVKTSPAENGDLDRPALDAGKARLDQVLGW